MAAPRTKICPACKTRNKPTWEFCVRCGESLAAAAVSGGRPEARAAEVSGRGEKGGFGWLRAALWGAFLVAAGVGAWMWFARTRAPVTPPASTFALPRAEASVPAAVKMTPGPGSEAFEEGRKRLQRGDAAGAEALLAQAANAEPGNALYLRTYAECLEALDKLDSAAQQFRAARALGGATRDASLGLGRVLGKAGRTDEAAAVYEEVLKANADDLQALRALGTLLLNAKAAERAIPHFRRAAELDRSDLVRQQELGMALLGAGQNAEAAEVFSKILTVMPGAVISRAWLADVQARQGQTDAALKTIDVGLALDPNAPLLHRARGVVFERAGKAREAAAAYHRYAQLAPNAPDAQDLESRAKKLDPSGAGS